MPMGELFELESDTPLFTSNYFLETNMISISAVLLADITGIGCAVACQCGQVHVTLSAVTLNFVSSTKFMAVAQLFRNAADHLPAYASTDSHFAPGYSQRAQ